MNSTIIYNKNNATRGAIACAVRVPSTFDRAKAWLSVRCSMFKSLHLKNGFTLIEVVIIITLSALIAALVIPFLGTAMTSSSAAVNQVVESFEVNQVMANIMADYRMRVQNGTLDLDDFKNNQLAGFEENGVTVTGTFIEFEQESGAYKDLNSDGVFDPEAWDGDGTVLLLVTASKNDQTLRVILKKEA